MKRKLSLFLQAAAIAAIAATGTVAVSAANAETTLRIAMTASDIPRTNGIPTGGFEGLRFTGYPIYDALVQWDLSRADVKADITPGLATEWSVDPNDKTKWTFKLRKGVKFHDGSDFNADAVLWNFDRVFNDKAPQYDPAGAALGRARLGIMKSARKIDDFTVEITTKRPSSIFPYMITYFLFASPAQFEKVGSNWDTFQKQPAGTGPFKVVGYQPRVSVTLAKNAGYWDKNRVPKVDKMVLLPMPEATTRLAALRSGQVDWIEVPPPDGIPSLKAAGFKIVKNIYPHIWPYLFSFADGSPFLDKKVRQAANYAVDRKGLAALVNGTGSPAKGWFSPNDPNFGNPKQDYKYDPDKARALLREAGYGPDKHVKAKVMISTSGSGQMVPLPMNEFIQQNMKESWFDIDFEVVDWGQMLVAFRAGAGAPKSMGADALNFSQGTSDVSWMIRYFRPGSPINWSRWNNKNFAATLDELENSFDAKKISDLTTRAHEIMVDEAVALFILHDLNSRAMSSKVKGFVSAQSWFQDFSPVYIEE